MAPATGQAPRGVGGVRAWLARWALLAALWLALADSRRLEEIVAAIVAGAIGASVSMVVRAQSRVVLRPRPAWVARALAPLLSWPRDLVLLTGALARRPSGRLVERPFLAAGDEPYDAARRALAVAGGSLAPNTIVVAIDPDRRVLLRHELVPRDRGGS